ncbi:MAG: hypothetical protein ACI9MR_000570 [Myxococcota bacterium]
MAIVMAACASDSGEPARDGHGPGLDVSFAPLSYPGAADVCYALAVTSENGEVVLARGAASTLTDPLRNPASVAWTNPTAIGDTDPICSLRFGNGPGGDWSYVAPCDADAPEHSVTLWLEDLFVEDQPEALVAGTDYQDPCPTGCALQTTCTENADTPVSFDLTIMRRGNQGFFDIAVAFDNVFCAAKLDCRYDSGDPIALLHDPDSGLRGQTAVLGLACTAGAGDEATLLLRDPITITCGADSVTLDPAAADGNVYTASDGPNPAPSGSPVWQYAVYAGQEALDCGGASCQKVYWNVALGFDPTTADCTLATTATAGSADVLTALSTPEGSTWPIIGWDVALTEAAGGLACTQHPLNGAPGGVSSTYTDVGAETTLQYSFDGLTFDQAGPDIVTEGLVLHLDAADTASYPGNGDAWFDLSGSNNHGTLVNGPTHGAEPPEISLDGVDQYVGIAQSDDFKFGTSDFTVELWLRTRSYNTAGGLWDRVLFIGKTVYAESLSWNIEGGTGRMVFRWNDAVLSVSTTALPIDTWVQYAFVRQGGTVYHYQNGLPDGATSWALTNVDAAGAYGPFLGRAVTSPNTPSGSEVFGDYGRAAVYNGRALTAAEIAQHFEVFRARYGL